MVATKLKTVAPFVALEQQTTAYAASGTLASIFTIPANCGEIWCYPSAACHWNPTGTATSAIRHAVAAKEPFMIPQSQQTLAEIIGDAGAITLTVLYMRGSRPAIEHAVSRPY